MPLLFKTFRSHSNTYAFDANTNSLIKLTREQYNALKSIENHEPTEESYEILKRIQSRGFCKNITIKSIDHPDSESMYRHLEENIENLTLQVTQNCNLRCDYCIYSGKYGTRKHAPKRMDFETAKKGIDFLISHSTKSGLVNIGFYGGEPLLELELIKRCISYIKERYPQKSVNHAITTNGTLLTPEVFYYLVSNGASIMISLDGPKGIHDQFRRYANGDGSYDDIIENVRSIRELYPDASKRITFNAVISNKADKSCTDQFFSLADIDDYYNVRMSAVNSINSTEPVVYAEHFSNKHMIETTKLLLHMLGRLDRKHVSNVIYSRRESYEQDYKYLSPMKEMPEISCPGGTCIIGSRKLFMNVDGDLFPCERVSETSEFMKIGNIETGIDLERAKALLNIGSLSSEECKNCWAILHCGKCASASDKDGECSRDHWLSSCSKSKTEFLNKLLDTIFLKENGYKFREESRYGQ